MSRHRTVPLATAVPGAILLIIGGVLWFRYSHCWDLTVAELTADDITWNGYYASCEGRVVNHHAPDSPSDLAVTFDIKDPGDARVSLTVAVVRGQEPPVGTVARFRGRVFYDTMTYGHMILADRTRFSTGGIAALALSALGAALLLYAGIDALVGTVRS